MEESTYPTMAIRLAKFSALVFHPLFLPFYGILLIFYSPTVLWFLPFEVKKLTMLIFASVGVLIPLSVTPFLINRGIISSWKMETQSDRTIPLLLLSILYGSAALMMHKWYIPGFIKSYIYTLPLLSLILLIINTRYRISLHASGAGAFNALIIMLSFKMAAPLVPYIAMVVILSGIVISSRLVLGAHSVKEVYTGYGVGLTTTFLLLLLL